MEKNKFNGNVSLRNDSMLLFYAVGERINGATFKKYSIIEPFPIFLIYLPALSMNRSISTDENDTDLCEMGFVSDM
jgi:hypothetical protein